MIVKQKEDKNSFYNSIRWVLVFGQFCGLIPVRGIFGPHHKQLRFTWRNPLLIYTVILIGMATFFDYALAKEIPKNAIRLDTFAPTAFYTTCLLVLLMFLNLARKFPEIAKDFYELEKNMGGHPENLRLKIRLFIVVFGGLAIVEHTSMIVMNTRYAIQWHATVPEVSFTEALFRCMMREVSEIVPFSPMAAICCVYCNIICTLSWNYLDFFLIAMSIQLSTRLQLLNDRISMIDLKKENRMLWLKILKNYNQISSLIKKMDILLSKFILLSLGNDFYHISLQLLRAFKMKGGTFQNVYFFSSMAFLILRLLTLSFSMSRIEDEGKRPLDALFGLKVPSPESNRLMHQILTDDVYLTGNQFFVINRKFVITVVGTIITYQVILLQVESLLYFSDKV